MNVGELFVNLGIKGSEKTVGALKNVYSGLTKSAEMSLEAKAGLVGLAYAFEQLMANSGRVGTNLTNFNAVLGVSAQTLQRYQYAARQVGVSNQAVEGSFKALQETMTKTLRGEGAPKGLARLAMVTGGINAQDIDKFAKNPELLLQRLQDYAAKEKNIGLRNDVIKSFGLGDDMIAALSRKAFTPGVLKKAPVYGEGETKSLDKANIAWSNLGNKIEMAVGHFNAKHGGQLVSDLSKVVNQVVKLAEAFTMLAEKGKLFEWLGKIFEGWTTVFGVLTEQIDNINKKGLTGAVSDTAKARGKEFMDYFFADDKAKMIMDMGDARAAAISKNKTEAPSGGSTTINQNLNFQHDGKDSQRTAHDVKKAVQDHVRQSPAQGWSN